MILGLQVVLILGVGVAYLTTVGYSGAWSSVYGGSVAIFSTWMLAKRVRLAIEVAKDMPGREVEVLYRGAVQRFAFILALFIIGMAILKFDPVPLLAGFAVAQGAFLLSTYSPVFRFGSRRFSSRWRHDRG
ncbi:MAG: ATP synthase subunit I [Gammaproteobacteria bacterium]|nr:ATP synthase subunit I [Gammaproteobacteria bacterium]